MSQVIVIALVLALWFLTIHWLHPRLRDRREIDGSSARASVERRPKSMPHPAFTPQHGERGMSEHQRAAHFPAHRSIRDLDQGRKLEVGDRPQVGAGSGR